MLYAKAVLDLLKDHPKRRQWLINQLCPLTMSKQKLQKTLNQLTLERRLIKKSRPPDSGSGWETWYMLPGQEFLLDVDAGRIISAVERFKVLMTRMPTMNEIALEIGLTPTETEKLLYELAPQIGWYNPTIEIIADAKVRLGEALVCAAEIQEGLVTEDGRSTTFDYDEDAKVVEEAIRFLKSYRSLLPKLSKDGTMVIQWPLEALRYLGENYAPQLGNTLSQQLSIEKPDNVSSKSPVVCKYYYEKEEVGFSALPQCKDPL